MSWPDRAGFTSRAVTDGEHKVHDRRSRSRELVPAFRAIPVCRIAMVAQHLQGQRIDRAFRLAACRVGGDTALPVPAQDAFGQDRPGWVASAEEYNIVGSLGHGALPVPHIAPQPLLRSAK